MVYMLRTGLSVARPAELYGPWSSVYTRWRRWCQCGLWARVNKGLLARRTPGLCVSGCQPHQGASGRQQSRRRPTTSGHRTHQRRAQYQADRLGGRAGRAVAVHWPRANAPMCAVRNRWPRGTARQRPWWPTRVTTARPCAPWLGNAAAAVAFRRTRRRHPAAWHRGLRPGRHQVENFFQRVKRYRRVGTRYDKWDLYFLSFVHLAAILDWLKRLSTSNP